ncbi:MAG TPA: hypothetical protein VHX36_17140 [Candidatus Acidoferrales bacterium]|jgi:hypothetical protein|nr:hypothetical protein [Candidatus Acidoferrales bacterium]
MEMPKRGRAPDASVYRALNHLQQAEFELLAAIRPDSHTSNADLLEVHAALWEAIALLTKAISERRGLA